MKERRAITLFSVVSILLASCAEPGQRADHATTGAVAGAAIGGASAYLLCVMAKRPARECNALAAAGLAVGALIGWKHGKERDLAEARAMQQQFASIGVPANLDVANAQRNDSQGKQVAVESFKGITVPVDPVSAEITAANPDMVKAMQGLGQLSVTRSEPTRVIYRLEPDQSRKVRSWLGEGIAEARKTKPGLQDPVWQELAYEKGKPQFVRVEPLDQTQFGDAHVLERLAQDS